MPPVNMMQETTTLMALGMGVVVVFLTLLVFATTAMSKLVAMLERPAGKKASIEPVVVDRKLLAVIATAVHKYRANNA